MTVMKQPTSTSPSTVTPNANKGHEEGKIPRPMNCFMLFRLEKQREIISKCPGANHRDISKITSKWWKEMTADEKMPYVLEAQRLKRLHENMYPDYRFRPKKRTQQKRTYRKQRDLSDGFAAVGAETRKELIALYKGEDNSQHPSAIACDDTSDSDATKATRSKQSARSARQRTGRLTKFALRTVRSKSVDNIPHEKNASDNQKVIRNRTMSTEPVLVKTEPQNLTILEATQDSAAPPLPTPPLPACFSAEPAAAAPSLSNGHYVVVSDLPSPPCYICPFTTDSATVTTDRPCINYNVAHSYYHPDYYPLVVGSGSPGLLLPYSAYHPPPTNYYYGYQHVYPLYSQGQQQHYAYAPQQQPMNTTVRGINPALLLQPHS